MDLLFETEVEETEEGKTGILTQDPLVSKNVISEIRNDLAKQRPDLLLDSFVNEESRSLLQTLTRDRHGNILNTEEKIEFAMEEIVGMGFVERIIKREPETTDIRFNGNKVTVKTSSRKYIYDYEYVTEEDVITIVKRFANVSGKDFTEKEPRMNAQVGYMRVNAVHRKNAPYGTTMAIRISKPKLVVTEENFDTLADSYILDLCKLAMTAGSNIILSGIPGSGKTELTKTLMGFLDFLDVIITVEDTPEGHFKLLFPHLDITSWYTNNNLTESDLIDEALRNDADWLMVTETRTAPAAFALLKSFLTGLKGVTSVHSASAHDIPNRYYNMVKSGLPVDEKAFYDDFYSTVDLGFHQVREWINGRIVRYIDEIVEFRKDQTKKTIYRRWHEDGLFFSEAHPLSKDFVMRLLSKQLDISVLDGTGLISEEDIE